jgi:hypothetical protein
MGTMRPTGRAARTGDGGIETRDLIGRRGNRDRGKLVRADDEHGAAAPASCPYRSPSLRSTHVARAGSCRWRHSFGSPSLIIVGRTSTYLPQVITPDGDQANPVRARSIWGAGAARSVSRLERLATRVVVLRDTPHAPFDVPACISWDPSQSRACDFPRTRDGHSDDAEYESERAAGVPASVYADPAPAVCPRAICHVVIGGVIVFRDDNHLTAAFAASRWREFAAALSITGARRSI